MIWIGPVISASGNVRANGAFSEALREVRRAKGYALAMFASPAGE
jgi:hypothetical protein